MEPLPLSQPTLSLSRTIFAEQAEAGEIREGAKANDATVSETRALVEDVAAAQVNVFGLGSMTVLYAHIRQSGHDP